MTHQTTKTDSHPCLIQPNGAMINLLDPASLDIRFMAEQLTRIRRFNGDTTVPYSVADHLHNCVRIARAIYPYLSPRSALNVFLHDGHEAWVGDVITPVKLALSILGSGRADFDSIVTGIDRTLYGQLGLMWPPTREDVAIITEVDHIALALEDQQLRNSRGNYPVFLALDLAIGMTTDRFMQELDTLVHDVGGGK